MAADDTTSSAGSADGGITPEGGLDDAVLTDLLRPHLDEEAAVGTALAQPESSLFELGLDSIATFALLDDLAARGVTVDFTEFVASPTVALLREAATR